MERHVSSLVAQGLGGVPVGGDVYTGRQGGREEVHLLSDPYPRTHFPFTPDVV